MTRGARLTILIAVLVASASAAVAVAADGRTSALRVPIGENPTPTPPEPVPIPPPSGPCADVRQRCPDLVLRPPSDLRLIRSRSGRLRLGSRNRLVNRGAGPLYLIGRRDKRRTMKVSQRIYSVSGAHRTYRLKDMRFDFWFIPGQGRYWKLRDALRFELRTTDGPVERLVKVGRKTRFCMRDLIKVPVLPGPRGRVFGGCSQSSKARSTRMGISVGWMESYPSGYHEQYVDVTGLRGCYVLRQIADPRQHVMESDESNNMSQVRVRLGGRRLRAC
ncbi:MAG: lysyl oxidase family protein [Solirubrobacteraceae bacterium]